MLAIQKYPRTQHLEGSRLQAGDEDLDNVPFAQIKGRFVVVEEKVDGANAGVRFDEGGQLHLQSRGHFLTGGPRERQWDLFKQWANTHADGLLAVLEDRFALYGEWMYAKHTVFYDQLPHYFLEFDILDTHTGDFLSTERRRELLAGLPIVPVPVLWSGIAHSLDDLLALGGPSLYRTAQWREHLRQTCDERGLDAERAMQESDATDLMEGLYIKVEKDGRVVERYKWVRATFLNSILDSGTHWLHRPIVPNRLADGIDLFGAVP
jgi:hypothetical protein